MHRAVAFWVGTCFVPVVLILSHSVFSITFSTPNSNSISCLSLPLLIDLVLGSESNSLGFALDYDKQ